MPAKKFNVDAILKTLKIPSIRNVGVEADKHSVEALQKIMASLGIKENTPDFFKLLRMIKHSGDTVQTLSTIIINKTKYRSLFGSNIPYLYTEDLIAFANGINYYINTNKGKQYSNVFTITENKNYALQSENSNRKGGYYLFYTEPTPPTIEEIIKGFFEIGLNISDGELDITISEKLYDYFKEKLSSGTSNNLQIATLFKDIFTHALETHNINTIIKYLYINRDYLLNKYYKTYSYNFSFLDGSFPMSGGKKKSPASPLIIDNFIDGQFYIWVWLNYLPKILF